MNIHRSAPSSTVYFALVAAFIGLATYFYLNAGKLEKLRSEYTLFLSGSPAEEIILKRDGHELTRFRLASTGYFDFEGQRQLHFQILGKSKFDNLKGNLEETELIIGDNSADFDSASRTNFIAMQLPRKKIYLVREHGDSTRTISALLWQEKQRIRDVLRCQGKSLCNSLRFGWAGGVGPLEGPYLNTDLIPLRRGMPRGRWGLGPASIFIIESKAPANALLRIVSLDPIEKQSIQVTGKGVINQKRIKSETKILNIGGKRFYPKIYLVEIMLGEGRNRFSIEYSGWYSQEENGLNKRASYLVSVVVIDR